MKYRFFCGLAALFAFALTFGRPCAALAADEAAAELSAPAESREAQQPPNEVFLDADEISYDEHTGVAVAEGNVKLRNKQTRLFAPYAEYNAETNIVDAYSDHREDVVIFSGGDRFTGKHLKYNMETRRGVLTQVSGKSEAMYMQGGTVRMMPIEEAVKQGIVRAPRKKKKQSESEDVAEWLGVTSTTCDFTNPHYRLVSKKVTVFPGKKTVLKQPKFYIGKTLIMAYPFDYIANSRKNRDALAPIIRYNSNKGMGFGIKGPIDMGSAGELDIAALYWSDGIWEGRFQYNYEITDSLSVFGSAKHLYNKDTDDTKWRPSWGLLYENSGWLARLWWAERDLIGNEVETDVTVDYDVWRKPEFYMNTPWINDGVTGGKFRFFGIWGKYQDNYSQDDDWTERFVYGAQYQGEPKWSLWIFKPFYGARYAHYEYPGKDKTQDVTNAWFGFSYQVGVFSFTSSYNRRWGTSGSPMAWDRYSDSESFSQSVSFPLPLGAPWEKWTFSVSGNYDFLIEKISSVSYSLNYNKHCMTWQLWCRDKISENEQEVGLTFYINAYPEYKLELGSNDDESVKEDF
ncbi:MAG: hypothetical protein Q4D58_01760 [Synergistaceae bacterium]|nr:hypothetical protein [Synergistaceae bacterium]